MEFVRALFWIPLVPRVARSRVVMRESERPIGSDSETGRRWLLGLKPEFDWQYARAADPKTVGRAGVSVAVPEGKARARSHMPAPSPIRCPRAD